ncbi:hypothetical protein Tco_1489598, partial [Tanacetum coccineum]
MINYMPTFEANEIRAERAIRNHDLLALVADTYNPPSTYNNPPPQSNQVLYPPQHSYAAPAIMFLNKAFTTEYPATNNQLRTSSNPRTQANVQDGRVTIQNVQGRQTNSYGNNGKGKVVGMDAIKIVGDYAGANAQRKKKKGYTYEEEHDFMADVLESFVDCEEELNTTSLFMADCVDAFDSYCNEDATSEILMAKISHARRVTNNNMQHLEQPIYVKDTYMAETNDNNVILDTSHTNTNEDDVQHDTSCDQENAIIMSVIENMQREVVNQETKQMNESFDR